MPNPNPKDVAAEVAKRQAAIEAQKVHDPKRARQRQLAIQTMGKVVHDIVGPFPDANGDEIVIWVFSPQGAKRDFRDGEKTVVMVLSNEVGRQRVTFDEVTVKGNRFYLRDGSLLSKVLAEGTYDY